MATMHRILIKRTVYEQNSVPDDVVLCELSNVPFHLFW